MGHVDYEEWFESVDIGSVPLSAVAYVVADLYRDLFEVCVPRACPFLGLTGGGSGLHVTQRAGPMIRAVSPEWQIRSREDSMGICFGQLRLARLYSYDYVRVYPEIVVVTPR